MTPQEFIRKWTANTRTERAASQTHFNDLCALLGVPTPLEVDPTGDEFTFEKGATKLTGGEGFADVWKRHCFAWEYKGKHGDLDKAYAQLKRYADALDNPPLLIVCDMRTIIVHTAFTNAVKQAVTFTLTDLENAAKRQKLKAAFSDPEEYRPGLTRDAVTAQAAEKFSALAHGLHGLGFDPHDVAHFLNKLIFCMFAEDVGILPNKIFSKMVKASVAHSDTFEPNARTLFKAMSVGGVAAFEPIDRFNGGLFDGDAVMPLQPAQIRLLDETTDLDWSNIEPSIFGTLFERGLDPDKRSEQGAHYTDPGTIMKLVRPLVVDPWEREWEKEKVALAKLIDSAGKKIPKKAADRFNSLLHRLRDFRILDPACGSGNFLYLSLLSLKNIEKKIIQEAEALGFPPQFPSVGPEAVLGIEINPYAAELARVSVWIGELQWQIEHGFPFTRNPILRPLNQIECRDSVLSDEGMEPTWPKANVIVGNPPFLGDRKMIRKLGEEYTERLRSAYEGRVSRSSDLCCWWFERARQQIVNGLSERAGLVATANIRRGNNRLVLDEIDKDLVIFDAWQDEDWVNEGAAVRVSLVCFTEKSAGMPMQLDGKPVQRINSDLTRGGNGRKSIDVTQASPLRENSEVSFIGVQKSGPFDISADLAREWLKLPRNPNGKKNADVVKPWANGLDIVRRYQDNWIIDFGPSMTETEAACYEAPFEYVLKHVKPIRDEVRRPAHKKYWWRFGDARPGMRAALAPLERFIVTPEVSKHRLFAWLRHPIVPDKNLTVIARSDDATFGVLHSRFHEVWALKLGTRLEDRPRYTSSTTLATFPFPEGMTLDIPEKKTVLSAQANAVAAAARHLDEMRQDWLTPKELVKEIQEVVPGFPPIMQPVSEEAAETLATRTLTQLYNKNPKWLQDAHLAVDEAVASAYGWSWPLTDDEILTKLLTVNATRESA